MNPYLSASLGKIAVQTASANGTTNAPTTTSGSFVVIPEMTVTLNFQGGTAYVDFSGSFNMQNNDQWNYAIFVDGVEAPGTRRLMHVIMSTALLGTTGSFPGIESSVSHLATNLSPGSHTFDVRWQVLGGTARANSTNRKIIAMEVF